jgi:hypothetical protein
LREGTPPDKVNPGQGESRQIKVNQGKSRQIKGNQGESRGIEGIKGKLSSPSEIRGISGIRTTSKQWYSPIQIGILWVWRYVYVWVCVSLGDGGSVGSQGKRAAAMAWGRPRWSSVPVSLWR